MLVVDQANKNTMFQNYQTFIFYFWKKNNPQVEVSKEGKHTHTHTHTYIHTYIHTHIHTYIHTYIHTLAHTQTHNHTKTTGLERYKSNKHLQHLSALILTVVLMQLNSGQS